MGRTRRERSRPNHQYPGRLSELDTIVGGLSRSLDHHPRCLFPVMNFVAHGLLRLEVLHHHSLHYHVELCALCNRVE
jgi:hypothetical protein